MGGSGENHIRRLIERTRPFDTLPKRALHRLGRVPLVQGLIVPFGRDLNPERWIFVVGCYNSGTTLLAQILRGHPDISGLPIEGTFLTDVSTTEQNGARWRRKIGPLGV